ncbi:hypothetical protein C8R47DRAFT_531660 [Mycena vitilis]|nr:hypothetical protein C8R47DRAFT_531660 [Mycena vitilis]
MNAFNSYVLLIWLTLCVGFAVKEEDLVMRLTWLNLWLKFVPTYPNGIQGRVSFQHAYLLEFRIRRLPEFSVWHRNFNLKSVDYHRDTFDPNLRVAPQPLNTSRVASLPC